MFDKNLIHDQVISIVAKLFDVPPQNISSDFGIDSCEQWDSITHLKLVASIEDQFQIQLSPEEQTDMLTVELIEHVLNGRV